MLETTAHITARNVRRETWQPSGILFDTVLSRLREPRYHSSLACSGMQRIGAARGQLFL